MKIESVKVNFAVADRISRKNILCLQRGRTEWTIKTNRVRKAKWWR